MLIDPNTLRTAPFAARTLAQSSALVDPRVMLVEIFVDFTEIDLVFVSFSCVARAY